MLTSRSDSENSSSPYSVDISCNVYLSVPLILERLTFRAAEPSLSGCTMIPLLAADLSIRPMNLIISLHQVE